MGNCGKSAWLFRVPIRYIESSDMSSESIDRENQSAAKLAAPFLKLDVRLERNHSRCRFPVKAARTRWLMKRISRESRETPSVSNFSGRLLNEHTRFSTLDGIPEALSPESFSFIVPQWRGAPFN